MRFRSQGVTHVGAVRRRNEDAFLDRPERGLWAVADGMGGHEAGDYASARIVAALDAMPAFPGLEDSLARALAALVEVDAELRHAARAFGPDAKIGSTVVALLAHEEDFAVIWAGDSRLYHLPKGGRMRQVTTDHSPVQEMVDAGTLRPEDAAHHPLSHVITRAIGAGAGEFGQRRSRVAPGDRLLLCSDGLTNMLPDIGIADVLTAEPEPQRAAEALVELVLQRGARDNVTVVVIAAETDE